VDILDEYCMCGDHNGAHSGRRITTFRSHTHSSAAVTALAVRRGSILTGTSLLYEVQMVNNSYH